jgi:uncharacterized membrane protein
MAIATITSGAYRFVLLLHILAVIVGFGTVFLNPVYGLAVKRRQGAEGLAITEEVEHVGRIAEFIIYAVPIFGLALVGLSDKVVKFSDTWVWLSLLLYVVGIGLSHAILLPNIKRMIVLQRELVAGGPPPAGAAGPPPQVAELERRGMQNGQVALALDVLLIVIVFLMIFKPGGPKF